MTETDDEQIAELVSRFETAVMEWACMDYGPTSDRFYDTKVMTVKDALIARIEQEQQRNPNPCEAHEAISVPHCPICMQATIERLRELLKVARCPDEDCIDGAVPHGPTPDGHWEACQCQWCDERKTTLEADDD